MFDAQKMTKEQMRNVIGGETDPPCTGCIDCYDQFIYDPDQMPYVVLVGMACGISCDQHVTVPACAALGGFPGLNCVCQ